MKSRGLIWRAAALATIAIVAAACGSSSGTAAPAATGGATNPPVSAAAASHAPAVTVAPVAVVPTAIPELAGVSATLNGLTSYQYKVTISGSPYGAVLGSTGMTGTVVNTPAFAAHFATSDVETIETDSKIWTKSGSNWDLSPVYAKSTNYDTFGPPNQISHLFSPSTAAYFVAAGDETVNGVPATHYNCPNQRALNFLSGVEGISGDAVWTADIWVAKTGGYPVSFKIAATGAKPFSLDIEISKANDPSNTVNVPA